MSAPLGSADVGDRRWQARWRTVSSYFSAPCLHVSLATGGAGGAAIFAVRFLSSRQLPLVDAEWPDGVDLTDAFVAVGRALCRAICDGRPVPRRLASPLVHWGLPAMQPP